MKDFAGKVAFITGGGAGLGLGIAKVFREAGSRIVIADIRQDHLDEAMAKMRQGDMKGESFGRPRPDLDWVKPRKIPPPPPNEE